MWYMHVCILLAHTHVCMYVNIHYSSQSIDVVVQFLRRAALNLSYPITVANLDPQLPISERSGCSHACDMYPVST